MDSPSLPRAASQLDVDTELRWRLPPQLPGPRVTAAISGWLRLSREDDRVDDSADLHQLTARSAGGRTVYIRAVPRGQLLRDLSDGSGQLPGLMLELAAKFGALLVSRLNDGWTVGVVSLDEEPWAGQRVLYRETLNEPDPQARLLDLKRQVEDGKLAVPQPRDWRLRRKRPST
jgi:hypothetical protein